MNNLNELTEMAIELAEATRIKVKACGYLDAIIKDVKSLDPDNVEHNKITIVGCLQMAIDMLERKGSIR